MENAYMIGFCKTAEAYGVDPERLIKTAQMFGFLKGLGAVGRGLGALGKYTMRGASATARGAGRVAGMASQLPSQAAKGARAVGRATGQAAKGLKQDFMRGWRSARPAAVAKPMYIPDWARLNGVKSPATGTRGIPGLIQSNTPSATISSPVVAGLM